MKKFKVHMMYDPKTGKGYKANKPADHTRMKAKGYTHTKPKTKKQFCLKSYLKELRKNLEFLKLQSRLKFY